MKLIIAGTRSFAISTTMIDHILSLVDFQVDEVVSGGASGVDEAGELWAEENDIGVKHFYPEWDKYGKSAGPRRNAAMAEYGDGLLLIWDGSSKGSLDMYRQAKSKGLVILSIKINGKGQIREATKIIDGEATQYEIQHEANK